MLLASVRVLAQLLIGSHKPGHVYIQQLRSSMQPVVFVCLCIEKLHIFTVLCTCCSSPGFCSGWSWQLVNCSLYVARGTSASKQALPKPWLLLVQCDCLEQRVEDWRVPKIAPSPDTYDYIIFRGASHCQPWSTFFKPSAQQCVVQAQRHYLSSPGWQPCLLASLSSFCAIRFRPFNMQGLISETSRC